MRVWKYISNKNITYAVDYEDDMSFLMLHFYRPGIISCGYVDRLCRDPTPGAYYYETSWLDLLVVTGATEEMLREVKEQCMHAERAAEFLNTGK